MSRTRYYLGVDLAQSHDFTAFVILEESPPKEPGKEKTYAIRHLERFRDVLYPDVADRIARLMTAPILRHRVTLVVDQTGVGPAVTDLLKKRRIPFMGVHIHGGANETRGDDGSYRVPKRNLISSLLVLMQSGRLRIAKSHELSEILKGELQNFRITIDPRTAHDSYSHWRENQHDDLLLAASLATWAASKMPVTGTPTGVDRPGGNSSYWAGFGQTTTTERM